MNLKLEIEGILLTMVGQPDELCKGHQFYAEGRLWKQCKDVYEYYLYFGKSGGYEIIAGHCRKRVRSLPERRRCL